MDFSNIDNHSKASAFNKFKYLLYKYYPRFSKIRRVLSIEKLLKNDNVPKLGMGRNSTTPLYSDTTKRGNFFDQKK